MARVRQLGPELRVGLLLLLLISTAELLQAADDSEDGAQQHGWVGVLGRVTENKAQQQENVLGALSQVPANLQAGTGPSFASFALHSGSGSLGLGDAETWVRKSLGAEHSLHSAGGPSSSGAHLASVHAAAPMRQGAQSMPRQRSVMNQEQARDSSYAWESPPKAFVLAQTSAESARESKPESSTDAAISSVEDAISNLDEEIHMDKQAEAFTKDHDTRTATEQHEAVDPKKAKSMTSVLAKQVPTQKKAEKRLKYKINFKKLGKEEFNESKASERVKNLLDKSASAINDLEHLGRPPNYLKDHTEASREIDEEVNRRMSGGTSTESSEKSSPQALHSPDLESQRALEKQKDLTARQIFHNILQKKEEADKKRQHEQDVLEAQHMKHFRSEIVDDHRQHQDLIEHERNKENHAESTLQQEFLRAKEDHRDRIVNLEKKEMRLASRSKSELKSNEMKQEAGTKAELHKMEKEREDAEAVAQASLERINEHGFARGRLSSNREQEKVEEEEKGKQKAVSKDRELRKKKEAAAKEAKAAASSREQKQLERKEAAIASQEAARHKAQLHAEAVRRAAARERIESLEKKEAQREAKRDANVKKEERQDRAHLRQEEKSSQESEEAALHMMKKEDAQHYQKELKKDEEANKRLALHEQEIKDKEQKRRKELMEEQKLLAAESAAKLRARKDEEEQHRLMVARRKAAVEQARKQKAQANLNKMMEEKKKLADRELDLSKKRQESAISDMQNRQKEIQNMLSETKDKTKIGLENSSPAVVTAIKLHNVDVREQAKQLARHFKAKARASLAHKKVQQFARMERQKEQERSIQWKKQGMAERAKIREMSSLEAAQHAKIQQHSHSTAREAVHALAVTEADMKGELAELEKRQDSLIREHFPQVKDSPLTGTHLQRLAEKTVKAERREQMISHLRHLYHQARKQVVDDKGAVRLAQEQLDRLHEAASEKLHGVASSKEKAQNLALQFLKEKTKAAETDQHRIGHQLFSTEGKLTG